MRSSIACARCRRSKTKCENNGTKSICKSCAVAKKECSYDIPTTGANVAGSLRRESTADGEGPPKKRRKQLAPISSAPQRPRERPSSYDDVLESPLLTAQVWEELFDIYEKHLAIDFPFFHKRTFLSCVQQQPPITNSDAKSDAASSCMPQPHYPPLLLAFLTQTARFHPALVKPHNDDPILTADFYAEATRAQMGKSDFPGEPTLEKIQALLMLGYHEWTAEQGTKGWVRIGTAIRCAQGLKYHRDADHDDRPSPMGKGSEYRISDKDQFILRETKRRTFWSCCLMDRYLSWGENRPAMLISEDFQRIQLPCSDGAFNFGRKVRTRLLGEADDAYEKRRDDLRGATKCAQDKQIRAAENLRQNLQSEEIKWEVGDMEGELTWYIKVVDLFGAIVKWSGNDGRRQEGTTPPWDDATKFKQLECRLKRLKAELPDHLQLTPENTEDRIYNGSDKYVLIHALYTVCTVFLYREYMAMAPWGVLRPVGPLDEPLITEKPPHPDYWLNQARDCWNACKVFVDLLHSIQSSRSHSNLIQMPTVAFTAFTVASCTIYCHYFPNMDPDRALDSRLQPKAHDVANGYLVSMLARFKMARTWIVWLARWQRYYRDLRAKYKDCGGKVGDSPQSSNSDGSSGGLKDYYPFEKTQKEFGSLDVKYESLWDNKELDMTDSKLLHEDDHSERTEPANPTAPKFETVVPVVVPVQNTSGFTAVNNHNHTAPATPHLPSDNRALTSAQVPFAESQTDRSMSHTGSVMQYRTHPVPIGPGYYDQNSYPHNNIVATRVNTGLHQGHEELPQHGPVHANVNYAESAKTAIELQGQRSHALDLFQPVFMGDGESSFAAGLTYPGIPAQFYNDEFSTDMGYYPSGPGHAQYMYQPPNQ